MDGDVQARTLLEPVEGRAEVRDRLVGPVEGGAEDPDDPDGVLVAQLGRRLRVEVEPVALHGDLAGLDLPEVAELLPADLDVHAHDEVGARSRVAVRVPLCPAPLQRHPREHAGLARTGRGTAHDGPGIGRVPQVREHGHAASLQLGGARVLVLVDHVLVEALRHQHPGLRLHPGGDEGGEIQPGVAVQHQFVVDQLVRDRGCQRPVREPVLGRGLGHVAERIRVAEEGVDGHRSLVGLLGAFVERHELSHRVGGSGAGGAGEGDGLSAGSVGSEGVQSSGVRRGLMRSCGVNERRFRPGGAASAVCRSPAARPAGSRCTAGRGSWERRPGRPP